jgi:hypothetical protein
MAKPHTIGSHTFDTQAAAVAFIQRCFTGIRYSNRSRAMIMRFCWSF